MYHICIDVDDVLNNLMKKYLDYFNHPKKQKIQYKDLKNNPPHEILGIDKLMYLNGLDYFRYKFYSTLEPNKHVLKFFEEHGHKAYFSVLTATPSAYSHIVANWVMEHYGRWIRTFAFIPSLRVNQNDIMFDKCKADWLKRNKVDYFIDDNIQNCDEAVQAGITTFLVKQPWNKGKSLPSILKLLSQAIETKFNSDWMQDLIV